MSAGIGCISVHFMSFSTRPSPDLEKKDLILTQAKNVPGTQPALAGSVGHRGVGVTERGETIFSSPLHATSRAEEVALVWHRALDRTPFCDRKTKAQRRAVGSCELQRSAASVWAAGPRRWVGSQRWSGHALALAHRVQMSQGVGPVAYRRHQPRCAVAHSASACPLTRPLPCVPTGHPQLRAARLPRLHRPHPHR
jgi:hypothetical protein